MTMHRLFSHGKSEDGISGVRLAEGFAASATLRRRIAREQAKGLACRWLVCGAAICVAGEVLASDDLVVEEDREITSAMSIGNANIRAKLFVNNVKVMPDKNTRTDLSGTNGVPAELIVTGAEGKYNDGAANAIWMVVGTNATMGCLTVRTNANARAQHFYVDATATSPSTPGTNTVLKLESGGMAVLDEGINYSTAALARIYFDGGTMRGQHALETAQGAGWLLEAAPGGDLSLYGQALQSMRMPDDTKGAGFVILKSDRDIVFGDDGSTTAWPYKHGELFLQSSTNRLIWAHTGDLVLSNNTQLIISSDDCLPRGSTCGGIRITKTIADKQYFTAGRKEAPNILFNNAFRTPCNWIDVQDGFLSNMVANVARLQMGTFNEDTSFKGHVHGNVRIEKSGTGTLTLADARLPHLSVTAGSLLIEAGKTNAISTVEDFNLNNVPEIRIDGATLDVTGVMTTYVDTVSLSSDSRLTVHEGMLTTTNLTCSGTLVKEGAADFVLRTFNPLQSSDADVQVNDGTFRFAGLTCTNHWWRFTFKKTGTTGKTQTRKRDSEKAFLTFALGKIHLHSELPNETLGGSSSILNQSLTVDENYNGSEADLSGLQPGTITYVGDYLSCTGTTVATDFSGGAQWMDAQCLTMNITGGWSSSLVCTNVALKVDDPTTYKTIAFRLKSSKTPYQINGYSLAKAANCVDGLFPSDWMVETSPSGKPGTWTVVDERSGETANPINFSGTYKRYPRSNDSHTYLFNGYKSGVLSGACDISKMSATGMGVVDLSQVADSGLTSSELTVDFTRGGGTYTKYAFGETGVLRIVNVPDGTRVRSTSEIPVTLEAISGAENLKNWTVTVNGENRPDLVLQVVNGELCFVSHGIVLLYK